MTTTLFYDVGGFTLFLSSRLAFEVIVSTWRTREEEVNNNATSIISLFSFFFQANTNNKVGPKGIGKVKIEGRRDGKKSAMKRNEALVQYENERENASRRFEVGNKAGPPTCLLIFLSLLYGASNIDRLVPFCTFVYIKLVFFFCFLV